MALSKWGLLRSGNVQGMNCQTVVMSNKAYVDGNRAFVTKLSPCSECVCSKEGRGQYVLVSGRRYSHRLPHTTTTPIFPAPSLPPPPPPPHQQASSSTSLSFLSTQTPGLIPECCQLRLTSCRWQQPKAQICPSSPLEARYASHSEWHFTGSPWLTPALSTRLGSSRGAMSNGCSVCP